MFRNPEYYPDPTVGRALEDLRRKETRLNTGKQFEADWKSSMPKDAWCYRLKDSAAAYYGGNESLSFSIDNICDFDVYRYPMHHYFELKTIDTPSIPLEKILGRFDREKQKYHKLKHITDMAHLEKILGRFDREKQKYHKLKHITDMAHAAEFHGQTAHVVINYRGKVNRTFAISASAVLEYMNTQTRKSIPWQWAALNGIEVEQRLLRVHWRYDVEGLLKRLEGGEAV